MASEERDLATGTVKGFRQKTHQRLIGLGVHWGRSEADSELVAELALNVVVGGSG
jgi:hypothetical protein